MSFSRFSNVFTTIVSVVSLIAIILAYQNEILLFIQQYSEVVITLSVAFLYAVFLSAGFYIGQKRRFRRNKLRDLAPKISELNWFVVDQRIYRLSSSPEFDEASALQEFRRDWNPLTEALAELSIPYPQGEITLKQWRTYLEMLFPLALIGDIDQARHILRRIEGKPVETFWSRLKFWD